MTEVARLYATLSANTTGFTRGMDQVQNDMSAATRGWNNLESMVTTGAKAIGTAVVAGFGVFAGVVANATKSAASMEQQVANIAAVMRLSADEARQVSNLIKDLGVDPNLKVSAVEAGQAIEMLGKNGMTLEQIMGGAARATILLANATGADFAMSADVATDAMALFKLGADDMEKAVAGIVSVTQMSKFGVEDYRFALASAAPVLSSMGVSFDEFNAALTLSASNFASGRTAGTSWRLLMQNLVPSTDRAAEMMEELGLITEDGSNAFFTATGELKSMDQVLRILQSAFSGLSAEQMTAYARAIFGQEALGALNATIDMNVDSFMELLQVQSDVDALNESAATRVDTLAGAWEIFKSVLEATIISMGEPFLSPARRIVDWMTEIVSEHGPAFVEVFTKIANAFDIFIESMFAGEGVWQSLKIAFADSKLFSDQVLANILAVMRFFEDLTRGLKNFFEVQEKFPDDPAWLKALMRFGDLARPVIQYVVDMISQFVQWSDVLTALGIVVGSVLIRGVFGRILATAGPVLAIFAGLTLAVAALRNAWESDWLGIRTMIGNVLDYLGTRFALFNLLWALTKNEALQELADWVMGNETELKHVKLLWDAFVMAMKWMWRDLVNFVAGLLPEWKLSTDGWGRIAVEWIETAIPKAVNAIGRYINDIVTWVYVNANSWQIALFRWQRAAIEWIEKTIPEAVEKLGEWGTAIFQWLAEHLPVWRRNLATWGGDMWQWIVDTSEPTRTALARWGGLLWGWLSTNLPQWRSKLAEWARAAWTWIQDTAIPRASDALHRWGDTLFAWSNKNLPTWRLKMTEWATIAWVWIRDTAIPRANEWLGKWGSGLLGFLAANLSQWAGKVNEWATVAWAWIRDTAIPQGNEWLTNWSQSLYGFLTANLPQWVATLGEWAMAAWAWIRDIAMPGAMEWLGKWYAELSGYLASNIGGWTDKLKEWGSAAWQWIRDTVPLVFEQMMEWRKNLFGFLTDNLPSFGEIVGQWAVYLVKWIGETVPNMIREFGTWLS